MKIMFQIYVALRASRKNRLFRQQQCRRQRLDQREAERKRILCHKFNMFNKHLPIKNKIDKLIWELSNL